MARHASAPLGVGPALRCTSWPSSAWRLGAATANHHSAALDASITSLSSTRARVGTGRSGVKGGVRRREAWCSRARGSRPAHRPRASRTVEPLPCALCEHSTRQVRISTVCVSVQGCQRLSKKSTETMWINIYCTHLKVIVQYSIRVKILRNGRRKQGGGGASRHARHGNRPPPRQRGCFTSARA